MGEGEQAMPVTQARERVGRKQGQTAQAEGTRQRMFYVKFCIYTSRIEEEDSAVDRDVLVNQGDQRV